MKKIQVVMPWNYASRHYQRPFWHAMNPKENKGLGYNRAVLIWHRRSGKDKTLVNFVATRMNERIGAYYYIFPTYNQGRKILWEGRDRDGFKFLDHFPKLLVKGKPNDTEMKLEYNAGSVFRVIGSDNIDSIVGTNPVGCVFSEYALQDPLAWDYMRPILAENGGWAIFNYTPRGENHGYQLYKAAKNDPEHWFVQLLTVDDTKAIPKDVLEHERKEIIEKDGNDALYQQEYMCSFKVPIAGSYYATQMIRAQNEGRITRVPWEPTIPVDTWWDLGMNDSMAIWFTQTVGREVHVIDYLETNGEGFAYYAKTLREKPYAYRSFHMPHDIEVRELGTGKSRKEVAESLGIKPIEKVPNLPVEDGIEAVRNILSKCWFDEVKCERGLNALKSYHKEPDEKNKTFKNHPCHDWSEHGASSFRYFAVGYRGNVVQPAIMVTTPAYESTTRWKKLRRDM